MVAARFSSSLNWKTHSVVSRLAEPVKGGEMLFGIGGAGVPEEHPVWQVVLILGGFAAVVVYAVRQYFKQRKR